MTAQIRIGNGYDVHAFETGDHIVLGGVHIPFDRSFKAHSDGDVLIHSLCDALLGALALGDIGQHFPDTDKQYQGINSRQLLQQVMLLIHGKGYTLVNCDCIIVAQEPKLSSYLAQMRDNLGKDMRVETGCISIKATTTEWLGFEGRGEGIAVYSVVLLQQQEDLFSP